jgi:lipoprotein signal peptidase
MTSKSIRLKLISWFLFWVGIVFDLITKQIFFSKKWGQGIIKIKSLANFGLISGIDFGLLVNSILLLVFLVILILYFVKYQKELNMFHRMGMILILSGAVSNLLDRLILGYVRDWISVSLGFSFNFADVLVVAGLGLIIFPFKNKSS